MQPLTVLLTWSTGSFIRRRQRQVGCLLGVLDLWGSLLVPEEWLLSFPQTPSKAPQEVNDSTASDLNFAFSALLLPWGVDPIPGCCHASLAPAALAPMGASHAQLSQGDLLTKNCPFSQGPGRMPTTCLLSGVSG